MRNFLSFFRGVAVFLWGFIRQPRMVASVIPSSPKLVEKMLARVDWASVKIFVEYGPGVGVFSGHILKRLNPDAKLIVIDTNSNFVSHLRKKFADPRIVAVHASAAEVRSILADQGCAQADYILSGIPFSILPPEIGKKIAEESAAIIRPGGAFLAYQFTKRVGDVIRPYFQNVEQGFELLNFPPTRLYWAWK